MMDARRTLFMDVHVLQTVPPSCVNRDDTGSPKTAVYGGVTRARVSSQCWKHAMREMFRDIFTPDQLGRRTKHIVDMVAAEIAALDPDAPANDLAAKVLNLKVKLKDGNLTGALYFMSNAQAKALARFALEETKAFSSGKLNKDQTEKLTHAFTDLPGVDIALFGRMVADDPSLNNDACAQVAHSISTHRVSNEFDYFTALDDCKPEDTSGADHLGTVEFNSSTLYRYGTVAVHNLQEQLGSETASAVRGFLDAFVRSMPTGKQNTFANRTPADAVYVTFRRDQPVNLVGAFEEPVRAGDAGYVAASVKRLVDYAGQVCQDFVDMPEIALGTGRGLEGAAQLMPFKAMLDAVEETVRKECEGV